MKKPKGWDDQVVFSFRINAVTYSTLKMIADREKRSINKQLEIYLDEGIDRYVGEHEDIQDIVIPEDPE